MRRVWSEHFEIVFKIEDLPRAFITAFVLRDTHAVLPKLNDAGVSACLDHRARPQRHRVRVSKYLRTSCLIDLRKTNIG